MSLTDDKPYRQVKSNIESVKMRQRQKDADTDIKKQSKDKDKKDAKIKTKDTSPIEKPIQT